MIHILIPYDDKDPNRGEYFNESQKHLISKINIFDNIDYTLLDTNTCFNNSIDNYISKLDEKPFILVAYLHGGNDALFVEEETYISTQNAYFFGETLFYACSCLSANMLGQQLINNGCKVFLGFNQKISSANNETEPIFYHCENAFLYHFLSGNHTIQDCLSFMYDEYERMKIYLLHNYGMVDASMLEDNLNAFKLLVDNEDSKKLTKDFFDK